MTPLFKIITLARAGNPARAWALFVADGWDRQVDDPKALTLKGRLLKDQAKRADGSERVRLYGAAADAYEAAAELQSDSYALINAAALALLGGKPERSAELATQVLALVDGNPDEGENIYWRGATRAEALLLMGQETEARAALTDAIAQLPDAWEDHAATLGQFALILTEQGRDTQWLDRHRPPAAVHFSGVMQLTDEARVGAAISDFIARVQPGFAYGALAAGSDLLFAQAFLSHKIEYDTPAELHIILPFPVTQFRALSVAPFGDQWLPLFDDIMAQADTMTILGLDDPPLELAVDMADQVAMGQAIRQAKNLQAPVQAVTVTDAAEGLRPPLARWEQAGHKIVKLDGDKQSSATGLFETSETALTLSTVIWINGGDPGNIQDLLPDRYVLHTVKDGHWVTVDRLSSAYAMAVNIVTVALPAVQVSLVHEIIDMAAPTADVLQRGRLLASAAQPGIIATDYVSAMTLTIDGATQSIEEIGELQSPWGAQSLWGIV